MFFVFATMALSLFFAYFGRKMAATLLIVICLVLSVKQFLLDIYSTEDGFRMPWLQVKATVPFQQPDFNATGLIVYGEVA